MTAEEEKRQRLGNPLKLVGLLARHLQQRTRDPCKTMDPSCLQVRQTVKCKLQIASSLACLQLRPHLHTLLLFRLPFLLFRSPCVQVLQLSVL
ncbi:hypothetical protein LEMLEM_LOCUS24528 [Lemmus lemmus]